MGARPQRGSQLLDDSDGSIGYINIESNLFNSRQSLANQALGEKLKDTFCSIVHKDQEFDPNNFWRTNLDWPTAMSLFDQCVAGISDIIGETTLFRLACNYDEVIDKFQGKLPDSVPKVWDYWKVIFMPKKGFDPLSTPKDPSVVRVYPMILLKHSHHPIRMHSEEYLCGLNCVHAHDKSYVEIQACDIEWFNLVADFFGSPIDVWEGPLEDRFGWYGDVSKGSTYRLEPKSSKPLVSQLETVFVAAPKRIWLCRDGKERDAPEIYQRPLAIASSLEALQNAAVAKGLDLYGDKDPGLLLSCAFADSSAEEFDWFQYPTEVQDKARQLAGIKPDENFLQQMEGKREKLPRAVQIELVKLLNLPRYRITELSLSKEDRAKLEKVLTSKRVTRATDNWIASLLNQKGEWDITDHHYDPTYETEDGAAFY